MELKQCNFKKILIIYLSCFLAFAPLSAYGAPLTPDGSTRTTLDKARNNVPVVNIANPNTSGLSHNKFTHYNVNNEGLILNNANTSTVNTQLGGYIYGNPNLSSNAKVILNEVTSTNRSALNGYTEVAGPRTDLVIANPNGLTINGAGFINTSNVTLTTGSPNIVNGSLDSFSVNGGDIAIQGSGLDTQAQNSTAIYTQYLNLNAKIHAQNLDLKLGSNTINYQNKAITASGTSANPRTVLLDASALGGMYANRISLIGTDVGLGVNLPPEVLASTGDVFISNDGNIVLQKVSAGQQINVQSAQDIQLNDHLYSNMDVTLHAGNAVVVNSGVTAAKNSVSINAAQLINQSTILAGLNANGTLNNTGQMNVTSGAITNNGQIQSTGNLNATATGDVANNGIINAGNDLTLTSNNLTNSATLFAGNNMNLYTKSVLSNNPNANIFAVNNLVMAADNTNAKTSRITNNKASIEALNGNIDLYAVSLENITDAPVIQGSYVPAQPEKIVGGVTTSNTTTTQNCGFNCRNVTNVKDDSMVLNSASAPATINAGNNLSLNADTIINRYSLVSAGGSINLKSQVVDNLPVDIINVTTASTAMYRNQRYCKGFNFFGCWGGYGNRSVYVGTSTSTARGVTDTVASTIQAGGSIAGNVANLTNGNIKANQVIVPSVSNPAALAITSPVGSNGLFVLNTNPQSQFLIETNPAFASFGNFISSSYFFQKINFTPDRNLKLIGDAFYENKLIRDSISAQTGRRFLKSGLTSDKAQYQYLMDNALKMQADLQLVPGVVLTHAQIADLSMDIVWMEEQMVAGRRVFVPVVYIANISEYRVEGGRIIAGDDIELLVSQLNNSGLLEAGNDLNIKAEDKIVTQSSTIRSGGNLSLLAENDIENISASIKGKNILLASADGSIINRRFSEDVVYQGGNYSDAHTEVGQTGLIEADEKLAMHADKNITVKGSKLKAEKIELSAEEIEISSTVKKADFSGVNSGTSYKALD